MGRMEGESVVYVYKAKLYNNALIDISLSN